MHNLIIKPFAEEDALEAAIWYNNIKRGLGNEFLLALEAKINSIHRNPDHFQIVHKKIKRALTERFPYGIYYIAENDTVYVLAILHTRRNPAIWKKRKK